MGLGYGFKVKGDQGRQSLQIQQQGQEICADRNPTGLLRIPFQYWVNYWSQQNCRQATQGLENNSAWEKQY